MKNWILIKIDQKRFFSEKNLYKSKEKTIYQNKTSGRENKSFRILLRKMTAWKTRASLAKKILDSQE
jgi:hypothetical protein